MSSSVTTTVRGSSGESNDSPGLSETARALLLADLERFEQSVWHNEEIGEKRFDFLLKLITAVVSGLVALWATDRLQQQRHFLAWCANVTLWMFGFLTYLRMIHRDRVTAGYKHTANYIRREYIHIASEKALERYWVPRALRPEKPSPSAKRRERIKNMGYTQTVAVLNGALLGGVLLWPKSVPEASPPLSWLSQIPTELALVLTGLWTAVLCWHGAQPHTPSKEAPPAQVPPKGAV